MSGSVSCSIDFVLFDFGGVLAEEGFREGLAAIARRNGLKEKAVIALGHRLVHETGFVTGRCDEKHYWRAMREAAAIRGDDQELRNEILSRFILRDWMMAVVKRLRGCGIGVSILSDQTGWLDELDRRDGFFRCFDHVFNSFHMGKSKKDLSHFDDVVAVLGASPEEVLFIDDDDGHCKRAEQRGLNVIRYVNRPDFMKEMIRYCPFLAGNALPG